MTVLGWVIWALVCAWTLFSSVILLFTQPHDACLSRRAKRTIGLAYFLGMSAALAVTFVWVSKLHLLWFAPLFYLFGTQWILRFFPFPETVYHRSAREDLSAVDIPSQAGTPLPSGTLLGKEIDEFCRAHTIRLASALEEVIWSGVEYEPALRVAMQRLEVSGDFVPVLLAQANACAASAGIPYDRLSPLNQFIVALPGYLALRAAQAYAEDSPEMKQFEELDGRFVQERYGMEAAGAVKGALRMPFRRLLKVRALIDGKARGSAR